MVQADKEQKKANFGPKQIIFGFYHPSVSSVVHACICKHRQHLLDMKAAADCSYTKQKDKEGQNRECDDVHF